jgi:MoaA/NifB/PqqE/SkfB family radical SAM enzyme
MWLLARNFAYHVLRNLRGKPSVLRPLGAYLYLTYRCNLSCSYCNDGLGQKYPCKPIDRELTTGEWDRVLQILRRETDYVIFTGGEPTLRPDLVALTARARALSYHPICVLTNGVLLEQRRELLKSVDVLAISLDTLDSAKGDAILGVPGAHQRVLRTIEMAAALQRECRFTLCLIACILPEAVADAEAVLDHALRLGVGFAPAPASGGTAPVPGLAGNARYQGLIRRLLDLKRSGFNILGTPAYLEGILHFTPYRCLPTLLARVKPNGELLYPCSKAYTSAGNLLEVGDYERTVAEGERRYGPIGSCARHCQEGCYMDYSLLVLQPRHLLEELWLRGVRAPFRRCARL